MKQDFSHLDKYRVRQEPYASCQGDRFGAFFLPSPTKATLRIIATDGVIDEGVPYDIGCWEHVSVSAAYRNKDGKVIERTPTWDEMCYVKSLFWEDDETVIQFHPRRSEYVNTHKHVLHLWKHAGSEIELPPTILV